MYINPSGSTAYNKAWWTNTSSLEAMQIAEIASINNKYLEQWVHHLFCQSIIHV